MTQVMDYQQYPSYPAPYQAYSSPYPAYSSQPNHFNLKVREAAESFFSQSCTHVLDGIFFLKSSHYKPNGSQVILDASIIAPMFEAGTQQQV